MNNRERFLEIYDFLKPYQRIWQNEIMLLYPNPFTDYPLEWIDELSTIQGKSALIDLEKKIVSPYLTGKSLLSFYKKIEELCTLPQIPELPPVPETHSTWLFMIPKKQIEIKRLAPYINALYHQEGISKIIDIGGGIGLLAQTLNNQYGMKVLSVDMDPVLQQTGRERHRKNAKDQLNKVEYKTILVSSDNPEFSQVMDMQDMTLGLHTCGQLANDQIIASAKARLPLIVNFGCCYHKLEHVPHGQNISQLAQSLPGLEMGHFALTLASRAHRKMDEKSYDLKLKVKLYRYAIHFLLHDEYGIPGLITLGNSSPKLYEESFGTYALDQLARVRIEPKHTKEELDQYFGDSNRQNLITRMLSAGLIRNALGRVLEMYIQLDRAIFLEEKGHQVQLLEFFDEEVSPRNIGLVAYLDKSLRSNT